MMKKRDGKIRPVAGIALLGLLVLCFPPAAPAAEKDPAVQGYDNQGYKVFAAQRSTTDAFHVAAAGSRNLAGFYSLRQYPGSPPRIPHEVNPAFGGDETDCLSCHGKGGFSPKFGKFAPVTPHPENGLCYQCHAEVSTTELFVESEWRSIEPPKLGLSFLGGAPPPVPHSLQLRENCIACHTGPGAVAEIKVEHAVRGDCRQCHATVVQTAPFKVFGRE